MIVISSSSLPKVLTFILLLIAYDCYAAPTNKKSFIVGIDKYEKLPAYRQLTRSVADAKAISSELDKLGFEITSSLDPTRNELIDKWDIFINTIEKDDEVLIFLSGHGVEIEGTNYILTRDIPNVEFGRQEKLRRRSISVRELILDLQRREPQVAILIIDACRENPFIPAEYKGSGNPHGLARMDPPEGMLVLYSAAAKQLALDKLPGTDENPHSVYVRSLLPLIREPNITVQNLARTLMEQVAQLTKSIGHPQRPAYYDSILGHYCFSGNNCGRTKTLWDNMSATEIKSEIEKLQALLEEYKREGLEQIDLDLSVSPNTTESSAHVFALRDDGSVETLDEVSFYDKKGKEWSVPPGYISDGASIPRAVWSIVGHPLTGEYIKASVLHDYYVDSRTEPAKETHRMFHEAMLADGVTKTKASLLYFAVSSYGPQW